eukprot:scaffold17243_cov61-Phaeocystis_antarctica.AAC.3
MLVARGAGVPAAYQPPRRTRLPGAAQRSACARTASSPSRGATFVSRVCDAAGRTVWRPPDQSRSTTFGEKKASQFLA